MPEGAEEETEEEGGGRTEEKEEQRLRSEMGRLSDIALHHQFTVTPKEEL